MDHAVIVRGSMRDPTHIELEEPITGICGSVEIVVRPAPTTGAAVDAMEQAWEDGFDAWVQGHDRSVLLPSSESLRRESMYEDRK